MDERLSRDSAVPQYEQIKQILLRDIESGVLGPHSRLPSERKLVEAFGVSRITVRQALSVLLQVGYLCTQAVPAQPDPGSGRLWP